MQSLERVYIRTLILVSAISLIAVFAVVAGLAGLYFWQGNSVNLTSAITEGAIQPPSSGARADIFLQINSIPGGSTEEGHKDWIEVLAYNHGMQLSSSMMGQVVHSGFSILKAIDKSSPKLYECLNTGQVLPVVEIQMLYPDNNTAMLTIELKNVTISSITTGMELFKEWGSASPVIYGGDTSSPQIMKSSPMLYQAFGHDARFVEEVVFAYKEIYWNYTSVDGSGQVSSVVSGWNVAENLVK